MAQLKQFDAGACFILLFLLFQPATLVFLFTLTLPDLVPIQAVDWFSLKKHFDGFCSSFPAANSLEASRRGSDNKATFRAFSV